MNPHYAIVAARARHRCEYCHAPEVVFNFRFEVEHIIPIVRGGLDRIENQALACRSCNILKGASVQHVDSVTQRAVRLYHPRQDLWGEHFSIDVETATIEGLTNVGRATVARLGMNSPAQCMARRHWIRLGLFP